jgi:glutathione peroxidase
MWSFLSRFFPVPDNIPESIYDFQVTSINGGIIDFSGFKGMKILIVNTASLCGFTPQYAELEELYLKHKGKLMVVGFPSNSFMFQEPASNKKIETFCKTKYDITFPLAAKCAVKGFNKAPIYHWLTNKKYNQLTDISVKWNFQKYLIDETGKLSHIFSHTMSPLSPEIEHAISR